MLKSITSQEIFIDVKERKRDAKMNIFATRREITEKKAMNGKALKKIITRRKMPKEFLVSWKVQSILEIR